MSRHSPPTGSSTFKLGGRSNDRLKSDIVSVATETTGEVFDDSIIELIRDAETDCPSLLLCKGKIKTTGPRIEHRGNIYVPAQLEASILRSLVLPAGTADYGNASKLFDSINSVFLEAGFQPDVSETISFFVLSSWFPDLLPQPPCLLIGGSRPEALHLLRILACLARRPLPPLVAPNITALASVLPSGLAPTLLINAETLRPEKLAHCLASDGRSSNVIARGRLVDFCTTRAIFVGEASAVPLAQSLFIVNVEPSNGPLPTISSDAQAKLASEFQPLLLEYRLRNFDKVRKSTFDLPGKPAALRIAARVLGACIIDVPELQARAREILEHQAQIYAEQCWLDPRAVVMETALARCHEPEQKQIRVGELTKDVIALFGSRGEKKDMHPRIVGNILRSVGIFPKRLRTGYTFELTNDIRQKLHRLARFYGVVVTEDAAAKCPACLASITGESPKGNVCRREKEANHR
jgi:hypothetical protein